MNTEIKQQIERDLIADGIHFSEISDIVVEDRVWVHGPGGGFWYGPIGTNILNAEWVVTSTDKNDGYTCDYETRTLPCGCVETRNAFCRRIYNPGMDRYLWEGPTYSSPRLMPCDEHLRGL